ncbi:MAG TPA: hypothetical protein VKN14_08805 [Flavobacteriaceae bacterium]|nr:hypothetical protein [Flavobacteriaceae bacterium]
MIKLILHKGFSILMSLLVLVSTVSFTIEKHFCGEVLVDVALFTEAQKCGMEALEMEMASITKKSCCKDTVDIFEGQDELSVKTFDDLDFTQQFFLANFTFSYLNLFEGLPEQVIPYKDYSPPNLIRDIQVLDQVFII